VSPEKQAEIQSKELEKQNQGKGADLENEAQNIESRNNSRF
jgi:hypothetical protein